MKSVALSLLAMMTLTLAFAGATRAEAQPPSASVVQLPAPHREGELSVEAALAERRSLRSYASTPLSLDAISQVAWAAQGVTHGRGFRTAPSAGALFPLELYLVVGQVSGLSPGVYRYDPRQHALQRESSGDRRARLVAAALDQDWMLDSPVVLVIGGVYERSAKKYGRRAPRYVHMEVGHVAQNIYLQAEALGLGTCIVGGFDDLRLRAALDLPEAVTPLAIMPVGVPLDRRRD